MTSEYYCALRACWKTDIPSCSSPSENTVLFFLMPVSPGLSFFITGPVGSPVRSKQVSGSSEAKQHCADCKGPCDAGGWGPLKPAFMFMLLPGFLLVYCWFGVVENPPHELVRSSLVLKDACCQAWPPEFNPQIPHGERRELTLQFVLWSPHMFCDVYGCVHTHIINKQMFLKTQYIKYRRGEEGSMAMSVASRSRAQCLRWD